MTSITVLDEQQLFFPDPNFALIEPNGLLAIGGDLSTDRLILGYQYGIFPWFNKNEPILWWSPDPRAVLYPADLRMNRSFQKLLNKTPFEFKKNTDFKTVLDGCALPRAESSDTWLTEDMQLAYLQLHDLGFAHSYECWQDGMPVGGLYGVRLNGVFFAESMFRTVDNASKMAVYFLCQDMLSTNGHMIDIQIISPHMRDWGAVEISRSDFLQKVKAWTGNQTPI